MKSGGAHVSTFCYLNPGHLNQTDRDRERQKETDRERHRETQRQRETQRDTEIQDPLSVNHFTPMGKLSLLLCKKKSTSPDKSNTIISNGI